MTFLILIAASFISRVFTIWPPPYTINLSQQEDFIVFETFGNADGDNVYSDDLEMIKSDELRGFGIEKEDVKYFRIHQMAMGRRGTPMKAPVTNLARIKWAEHNYEKEDAIPWIAGFFKDGIPEENSNVFYLNEMAKSQVENKINAKRREVIKNNSSPKSSDYDYYGFKSEYAVDMELEKTSNLTLSFVDSKEEESFKEAFKNIVFKTPARNCTKEETSGIGLAAIECYWIDLHKEDNTQSQKTKLWKGILKIVVVWFCVYLIIAIPCWCQKGWCCCCFQCRFCNPLVRIDLVKKYIADNPVGIYNEGIKIIKYKPSHYEKYAQKRLEQALMKL